MKPAFQERLLSTIPTPIVCNYLNRGSAGTSHHRASPWLRAPAQGNPRNPSLTLRRGSAGRPTKGALRGADARATGTTCWALTTGLRMDSAGVAMLMDRGMFDGDQRG